MKKIKYKMVRKDVRAQESEGVRKIKGMRKGEDMREYAFMQQKVSM